MKEVDDTPVGESDESDDAVYRWLTNLEARIVELEKQIDSFHLRIANLEARKPPQDTNPDPEWYS